MIRKLLLAVIMLGVAVTAVAERTVYKWVDSRGQMHYTDRPPTLAEGKLISVYQERTGLEDSGDEAGGAATSSAPPLPRPAEPDAADDSAAKAAVQSDLDKVRVGQCKEARERYKNYIESRRLFKQTADGKRIYLTDQELTEARVQAKKDMDEVCK